MRIRLIRHGTTAGNAARRYVGRSDEPLCPEGISAAERQPKDRSIDRVYVSPMLRARQTAAILFPNAEQIPVEGLKEMDFGAFEGRTADEMENDPAYRAWVEDLCRGACPGGESQKAFHRRTVEAFSGVMKTTRSDATFVIHGGVIMSILFQLAEPEKDFYEWWTPNLGGYEANCAERGGGFVLLNVKKLPPVE